MLSFKKAGRLTVGLIIMILKVVKKVISIQTLTDKWKP